MVDSPVKDGLIRNMLSFLEDLVGISRNGEQDLVALHHDVVSGAFNECRGDSGVDGISAELPRGSFGETVAVVVLFGIVGICQLVDVVPEWVLTAGNRVPPTLDALAIQIKVFFVVLQLEGQIVTQHRLLFV